MTVNNKIHLVTPFAPISLLVAVTYYAGYMFRLMKYVSHVTYIRVQFHSSSMRERIQVPSYRQNSLQRYNEIVCQCSEEEILGLRSGLTSSGCSSCFYNLCMVTRYRINVPVDFQLKKRFSEVSSSRNNWVVFRSRNLECVVDTLLAVVP